MDLQVHSSSASSGQRQLSAYMQNCFIVGTQAEIQGGGLTASQDQQELGCQAGENCKERINIKWEVMDGEIERLLSWGQQGYIVGEENSGTTCTADLQFTGVLQYW